MLRIHIGVDLKDKSREVALFWLYDSGVRLLRLRVWGNVYKRIEELSHTEVIQCRTEEHGLLSACHIFLSAKLWIDGLHELQLLAEGLCGLFANGFCDGRVINIIKGNALAYFLFFLFEEELDVVLPDVVNPLEVRPHTNRQGEWHYGEPELLLHFIEEVKSIFTLSIELVDENNHRNASHSAYLNELFGLLLHPFCHIDDHNHRIYRCKGTVGVLRKVLVPRSIEDINLMSAIVECQHGSSHRNPPLSLDFHKVGSRTFLYFVGFYRSCLLNSPTEEEEFLCKGSFPCIGVGDNSKSLSFLYFFY